MFMFWTFNDLADVFQKGIPVVGGSPSGFSSPLTGGVGNPYSAAVAIDGDAKAYEVVALAKIDGLIFGMFQVSSCPFGYIHSIEKKGKKNHAEDGFISAYEEFMQTDTFKALAAAHEATNTQFSITLKLNKTPCEDCAPMLIAFKKAYNVSLRIKAIRQYKGKDTKAQNATRNLVQDGIPVIPFNIPERFCRKKYDKNRYGQFHELKYANFDEQEVDEEKSSDEMKTLVEKYNALITSYKASYNEKEHELAGVVVDHLLNKDETVEAQWKKSSTKDAKEQMREVLSGVYKRDTKRVNRNNFEEFCGNMFKSYEKLKPSELKPAKTLRDETINTNAKKRKENKEEVEMQQ